MTRNGLLYFHQGWTDIINCLPLINIYADRYKRLYVLIREDASPIVLFYIRGLRNVVPIFKPKHILDSNHIYKLVNMYQYQITGLEMIAHFDHLRLPDDPYRGAYGRLNVAKPNYTFERLFYESYDIPYIDRVNKFVLHRDQSAEELMYTRLVETKPYICTHTNADLQLFVNPTETDHVIELDKTSYVFFDMIRVLEGATAIHVIDSVWAAVCYLLDAKYSLFRHIPIYVYCHRGFERMFSEPVQLPNWNLVSV